MDEKMLSKRTTIKLRKLFEDEVLNKECNDKKTLLELAGFDSTDEATLEAFYLGQIMGSYIGEIERFNSLFDVFDNDE